METNDKKMVVHDETFADEGQNKVYDESVVQQPEGPITENKPREIFDPTHLPKNQEDQGDNVEKSSVEHPDDLSDSGWISERIR